MYRISHDLRSSVRALVELPEWVREDLKSAGFDLPEDVREDLDLLEVNAKRLDGIIASFLEYSRIGRFQTDDVLCRADVEMIIERCQPENARAFAVTLDFPEDTLPCPQPDTARLITALVSNAIKHHDMAPGRIQVEVSGNDGKMLVAVSDDGPGIPADKRLHVIELLTTLKSRDEVEGTGMGLAYAEKIARTYSGSLTIGDKPQGRGLCVTCNLAYQPGELEGTQQRADNILI